MLNNTQVDGTYQGDNDKCSHLLDPYTSLRSDKAATNNHLHSQSRFVLQETDKDKQTYHNATNNTLKNASTNESKSHCGNSIIIGSFVYFFNNDWHLVY